ncbi:hypothetical protein FND50_12675 [Rhodococcus sp. WB9]|nr:hypothetical protein FND50_12675 [Rhodococcus sp. WB9]
MKQEHPIKLFRSPYVLVDSHLGYHTQRVNSQARDRHSPCSSSLMGSSSSPNSSSSSSSSSSASSSSGSISGSAAAFAAAAFFSSARLACAASPLAILGIADAGIT